MPEIAKTKRKPVSAAARKSAIRRKKMITDILPDFGDNLIPRQTSNGVHFFRGIIIFIIIIFVVGVVYSSRQRVVVETSNQYRAVKLNNGQVYFGQITKEDRSNILMDNVFYLEEREEKVPALIIGEPPKTIITQQLVRKGDEFYGPENAIRINRSQVSVIENLTEDSQVMVQIIKYNK